MPQATTKDIALLPSDFPDTGLHVIRGANVPSRFQVLGERSSGTNFVKRLMGRNTGLTPAEDLGWKHGFPSMMAIPADLAVICMVRNAADWARSMHAKPWHTTPALQALEFSEFIRAEWDTIIDRPRYFDTPPAQMIGQPLQADRDPATGKRFANIFALRRAKIAGMLTLLNRDSSCAVLCTETAQAAPEATIATLCAGLGITAPDAPFRPVTKRLGSKFKAAIATRPDTPDDISAADMDFLRSQIDPAQEAMFGYSY